MFSKSKLYKNVYLYLIIFLILPYLTDGFKLRDLTGPSNRHDDTNKHPRKSVRDSDSTSKFKKIVKVVHVNDDGTEHEEAFEFKFEKVHKTDPTVSVESETTTKDTTSQSVFKTIENEQNDEENTEIEEAEGKLSFSLSAILGIIGFGGTETLNNKTDNKMIDWLTSFKKTEETNDEQKSETEITETWWSYLNRWPFNLLLSNDIIDNILPMVNGNISDVGGKSSEPISQEQLEDLLQKLPNFVLNSNRVDNIECKKQLQIFHRQLRGYKLWTLQMLDSSAKITSGLLRGDINQFGDFETCTQIKATVKVTTDQSVRIKGKYCLAHIDIQTNEQDLKLPVHLLQGRGFLKSHLGNPLHFVPRYTTINWGVCIPNACDANAVRGMFENNLKIYNKTGITFHLQIDEDDCYVRNNKNIINLITTNWKLQFTIGFYGIFLIAVLLATLTDYWSILMTESYNFLSKYLKTTNKEDTTNVAKTESEIFQFTKKVLLSFSLKRTSQQLFTRKHDLNDSILHILKFISIIFMYLFLKFLMLGHLPIINRNKLMKTLSHPLTIPLRTPFIYLDIFLLINGILSAYQMCNEMELKTNISVLRRFVGKFLRSLPTLFAVLFFQTWILPFLGSGPLWNSLIENNSKLCEQNMWRYFFATQNVKNIEEMCAPFSIQLAIDIQLFLITPLIVWLYYNNSDFALGIYGLIHTISVAVRYSRTLNDRLSSILFHGMNVSQFYRTANILYASPLHRATSYLIGIGTGIAIKIYSNDIVLSKGATTIGWFSSILSLFWCFWYPANSMNFDFVYDPLEAAIYSSWSPLLLSLSLGWIIFILSKYEFNSLAMKFFIFLNNISYPMQLVLYVVIIYNVADNKEYFQFNLDNLINIKEILLIVLISTIIAIIFDLPMQNLRKILIEYEIVRTKTEIESFLPNADNLELINDQDVEPDNQDVVEEIARNENDLIENDFKDYIITNGDSKNDYIDDNPEENYEIETESNLENNEIIDPIVIDDNEDTEDEEDDDEEIAEEDEIIRRPELPGTPEPYQRRRWNMDSD